MPKSALTLELSHGADIVGNPFAQSSHLRVIGVHKKNVFRTCGLSSRLACLNGFGSVRKTCSLFFVRKTPFRYNVNVLIGYARVYTEDQNLDMERRALAEAGGTKIFEEKESGRVGTKRPAF